MATIDQLEQQSDELTDQILNEKSFSRMMALLRELERVHNEIDRVDDPRSWLEIACDADDADAQATRESVRPYY